MPGFVQGRRARTVLAVTAGAVVAPLALVAVAGQGNPVAELSQAPGTVWVASPGQGLLSLIDGASEEVVAAVQVPVPSADLDVTQAVASAYVTDTGAGTVTRVDGGTYEASAAYELGTPGGGTTVLQGGGTVFVIDSVARTATRVAPLTLQVRSTVSLAAEPGRGQSVVDDDGRLWVVDSVGGGLTWVDGERRGVVPDVDAGARLVLVQGRPVLVDVAQRQVAALQGGGVGDWSCLDVRADDDIEVLGSRTADEVYAAVPSTGSVVVADVGNDDCSRVVPVGEPGASDFGALAQSGAYLFVPNRADGSTTVVDTRSDEQVASFDLTEPGHDVQLVSKDGLVFYNDLDSQSAGVLTLRDGTWVQGPSVDKYDPATGQAATVETPVEPGPVPGVAEPLPTEPSATPEPEPSTAATEPPRAPTAVVPPTGSAKRAASEPPPPDQLAVGTLTAEPAVFGADGVTTLSAPVVNARGARWAVTVRARDCDYELTTPMAAVPDGDRLSASLGPLASECLGVHTVDLVVVGPAGTATSSTTVELVADPASTPVISGPTCTPEHPSPGEAMTCQATESVVGTRGTWTWSVTDVGSGEVVLAPTARTATEPLVTTLPRAARYVVTLAVRYKGTEVSATTEVASSAVVPDVAGLSVDDATARLAELGLAADVVSEASNTVPAGTALRSDPGAGSVVVVGDTVQVVASGGPRPPTDLLSRASSASWSSGAGGLAFGGRDDDVRGFALIRPGTLLLEDGSAPTVLETHPEWVADGWIEGVFALDAPVIAGDRFRATVGFLAVAAPPSAGNATFRVSAVTAGGARVPLTSVSDTGADGVLRTIDIDLTSVVGAQAIVLRVEAGTSSSQDWAVWVAPRVSG